MTHRVLFDSRPVRDPISGVARYCLGVSEALASLPHYDLDFFVQSQGGKNPFLGLLPSAGTQVEARLFKKDRRFQNAMLEYLPSTHGLLFKDAYDILHETYFADLGRSKNTRKVSTIHDVIPLDRPQLFSKRNVTYTKRNFHRQAIEADKIIAVSDFTRRRILDFYPNVDDKIVVIGNGVDQAIIDGPPIRPLEDDDVLASRPFISFVGNVEPRKNLITMAKGFDAAFPAGSGWQMVIAGRKNYDAEAILTEITSVLGDRFCYLGPVDEDRKWQVMAHAHATVMSSEYEGFGIPIFESYAVKTPVLIADNTSMTELAVMPEQLFPTFSHEALAARLKDVLEDAAWVKPCINKGLERVRGHTWNAVAAQTADVYSQLV